MTTGHYNRYQISLPATYGMFTLRCDDLDEFKAELLAITGKQHAVDALLVRLNHGFAEIAKVQANSDPQPDRHDQVVTAAKEQLGATEVSPATTAPFCPGHGVAMARRTGTKGDFWACQGKEPDGTYSWKVKKGCKPQSA